jgi:hypothetical protein
MRINVNRACLRLALIVAATATLASAQSLPAPTTGTDVVRRMHDAYAGAWYRTLTFSQKTTAYRDGVPTVSTWYESLRYVEGAGTQLRIDIGEPSVGNGVLYTADSSWNMRAGQLTRTSNRGNEFLPLIGGVYMQPVARTVQQLTGNGFDLSRVTKGSWENRSVWIVGSSSAADTTAPQFWIDAERNVVVRMILSSGANAAPMDIHLDGYVRAGPGWLATKVAMSIGGAPRQTEEYSDWKTNVDLPPDLFDPAKWSTAPHWARAPKNPEY